jgi:NitT/TauT family transport system ATP-binding protein
MTVDATDRSAAPAAGLAEPPKVVIDAVSKSFRTQRGARVPALADLTVSFRDHAFVAIVGPSGCGKTTVLRLVDGLVQPDSGTVRVDGGPPRPGPHIGFVFQSFRLVPWETVRGNVGFALSVAGMTGAALRERVDHYLAIVGLTRFADAYPNELSGGMKQRVALARAVALEPEILLMDEPLASVDAQTRELMQVELMRLWSLKRSLTLFVTHSVDEAVLLADHVVLMSPRPGRVVEVIDVNLPRPRWEYDVRAEPEFVRLRSHLWSQIRGMVLADVNSDFYGRSATDPF